MGILSRRQVVCLSSNNHSALTSLHFGGDAYEGKVLYGRICDFVNLVDIVLSAISAAASVICAIAAIIDLIRDKKKEQQKSNHPPKV